LGELPSLGLYIAPFLPPALFLKRGKNEGSKLPLLPEPLFSEPRLHQIEIWAVIREVKGIIPLKADWGQRKTAETLRITLQDLAAKKEGNSVGQQIGQLSTGN